MKLHLGKPMQMLSTCGNPGPYILGGYPEATVTFAYR